MRAGQRDPSGWSQVLHAHRQRSQSVWQEAGTSIVQADLGTKGETRWSELTSSLPSLPSLASCPALPLSDRSHRRALTNPVPQLPQLPLLSPHSDLTTPRLLPPQTPLLAGGRHHHRQDEASRPRSRVRKPHSPRGGDQDCRGAFHVRSAMRVVGRS